MSKVLVSSGCSFAYGHLLPDRTKKYSNLLADRIGAKLIDVSVSGSSNENIAAATAYGINQALKQVDPSNITVVVGWTHINRLEFWSTKIARIQSVFLTPYGYSGADLHTKEIGSFVGEKLWEPCYTYYKLLHAFNYVHSLCGIDNIKVIHLQNLKIDKVEMPSGVILNASMRTENYTRDVLSPENIAVFESMCTSLSFSDLVGKDRKLRVSDDNFHPSEIAHRMWANRIYNIHRSYLT